MKLDTKFGSFALNVVSQGNALQEIIKGDNVYVVAMPGMQYAVQLVVPQDPLGYGAVFQVDGITCYGDKQSKIILAARPDAPPLPRGINQEEDDPSENEFPGPMVGNKIEGFFEFAQNSGTESAQSGLIQVDYYTNAYSPTRSVGASRGLGSDLHTELNAGSATVQFNSLKYEPGEFICSLKLRYASKDWLAESN